MNESSLDGKVTYSPQNFESRASSIIQIKSFKLSNSYLLVFVHIFTFSFRNSVRFAPGETSRKAKMRWARLRRSRFKKSRLHLHQILSIRSYSSKFCIMIIFFSRYLLLSLFFSSHAALFFFLPTPYSSTSSPPKHLASGFLICESLSLSTWAFFNLWILYPKMASKNSKRADNKIYKV